MALTLDFPINSLFFIHLHKLFGILKILLSTNYILRENIFEKIESKEGKKLKIKFSTSLFLSSHC